MYYFYFSFIIVDVSLYQCISIYSVKKKKLEPLQGGSLLFTTKFQESPGTPFCRTRKDEKLSSPWNHPVVLNMGPLDWESSALTTRPLILISFYISRYHFAQIFRTSFNIIGRPLTERPKSARRGKSFFSMLLKPSFLFVF